MSSAFSESAQSRQGRVLADFVGRRAKNQPRLRAGLGSAEEIERARVERAKAKDPQVWQAWFDAYYPSLFKYAYLRVRSRAEAEDIVSQVFLEAVEGIRRYEYQGRPIVAWLYRIAHNLIADRLKRERRLEDLTDGVPSRTDFNLGPEEGIENIDLITALAELTEEQQEVIILRFLLSIPAKEVASSLGKSEAAVFSLQARALIALRQRLGGGFGR